MVAIFDDQLVKIIIIMLKFIEIAPKNQFDFSARLVLCPNQGSWLWSFDIGSGIDHIRGAMQVNK